MQVGHARLQRRKIGRACHDTTERVDLAGAADLANSADARRADAARVRLRRGILPVVGGLRTGRHAGAEGDLLADARINRSRFGEHRRVGGDVRRGAPSGRPARSATLMTNLGGGAVRSLMGGGPDEVPEDREVRGAKGLGEEGKGKGQKDDEREALREWEDEEDDPGEKERPSHDADRAPAVGEESADGRGSFAGRTRTRTPP